MASVIGPRRRHSGIQSPWFGWFSSTQPKPILPPPRGGGANKITDLKLRGHACRFCPPPSSDQKETNREEEEEAGRKMKGW